MNLSSSMFETRTPNNNSEFFNKLSNEDKKKYLNLYECYSNMLYHYMLKKLNLLKYDNMLLNSEKKFISVDKKNMDLYQYLGSKYLKYYYIRNNLYIERLNDSEKKYLEMKLKLDPNGYDSRSESFIDKTYQKVCLENVDLKSKINTNYGPDVYDYFKPENAFIIGCRFDDYYEDENETTDEWTEQYNKRLLSIETINYCFEKENKDKLKVPLYILKYNDFSINYIFDDNQKDNYDVI